jgi:hypothetical protein
VASRLAQFVISIPENVPTSHGVIGKPLEVIESDSSGVRKSRIVGGFFLPYFFPLSWEDGLPKDIAIWSGNPLHMISTHVHREILQETTPEEPTTFLSLETGINAALKIHDCAAGTTIGVVNEPQCGMVLVLTPPGASHYGLARLDRIHSTPILHGTCRWRLEDGETAKCFSVDEEASRLLVLAYRRLMDGSRKWRVSLYDLH